MKSIINDIAKYAYKTSMKYYVADSENHNGEIKVWGDKVFTRSWKRALTISKRLNAKHPRPWDSLSRYIVVCLYRSKVSDGIFEEVLN